MKRQVEIFKLCDHATLLDVVDVNEQMCGHRCEALRQEREDVRTQQGLESTGLGGACSDT